MAQQPRGLGQQFGIGLFVAAGIAGQVTTPPYWARSSGENVVKQERVVYDQTSTPVFISTAAGPSITSTLASAYSETTVVTSRLVYDSIAEPPSQPPILTPSAFAYQPVEAVWRPFRIKPVPRSAFVFRRITNFSPDVPDLGGIRPQRKILPDGYAGPVFTTAFGTATPSAFAYQPVDALWLRQRKGLPDGTAVVLTSPAAATPVISFDVAARPRRIILPDGYAAPIAVPPTATPAAFGSQFVEATWRQQRKVLPDGIAVPLTSPAAATPIAPSDAAVRARRISLPDGYAAPVSAPAPVSAVVSVGALANSLTVVRTSLTVLAQTSTPVFPPAPPPGTPVELRFVPDNDLTVVRTVCVVLDQVSVPPPRSPYVAPVAYVGVVHSWDANPSRSRIKPVQPSAFVFAYPVDDLAVNDDNESAVARVRAKRKILPEGIAQPPFQPVAVTPPAVAPLASAYSSTTIVLSRVIYDQGAARPLFPPVVVVVTPTFYQADEGAPQRRVSRPGIKLDLEGFERPTTQQQTLFWFETYPAVRTAPISARAVRSNLDGVDRPVIQITVTPSYLFETIAPPWKATPNAKAIRTDLDGFRKPDALPAPPTATPVTLFDNIGPLQRRLPNRVAIKTDLDGAVWPPQDPRDLHGIIFVPPITTHYPTGGESYWHVTHKPGKTDRRCRFVTIDGVLTWICDRLDYERPAEARLQALDLVYDAEGELEPLYEALRVEEATNASAAKRAAAALLMHAIHEAVLEEEDDDLLLLD